MIRLLALFLVALLWLPLLVLASYESYAPSIMGRWSFRFFVAMLAYVALVLPLTVILGLHVRRTGLLQRCLEWLRDRTWCYLFALLFPVAAWLLLAVFAAIVQPGPALYYRFLLRVSTLRLAEFGEPFLPRPLDFSDSPSPTASVIKN